MEFRLQYLQAMRQQAPAMFNRLNREGKLDQFVAEKAKQATELFQELTRDAPKEQGGYPKEPYASEAMEAVLQTLIDFPNHEQTTRQSDERSALLNEPQTS
jgi:hypothetical protein